MKEKKYFLLLALVSLFLLVNIVQKTYAKYVSSAEANANFSVAQWGFKVNNQDVIAIAVIVIPRKIKNTIEHYH